MLGRASQVNLHDPLTSFRGFVRQYIVQESYPSISKTFVQPRLGRLTIGQVRSILPLFRLGTSGHIGNLQVFDENNISLI